MDENDPYRDTTSSFFRTFFFSTYVVEGKSMMPTLQDGNMLVVNKVSYQVGELHRFDVVVFHANKKEDYVKRIIGLPGDYIEYKQDKLYINGQFVDEPYLETYKEQVKGRQLTGDFKLEELTKKRLCQKDIFLYLAITVLVAGTADILVL